MYQSVWEPSYGEILMCEREPGNRMDPFAVAVIKNGTTVGHVPRMISASCSLFLRKRGSSIYCKISGTRRYSRDLPQGGLEVPCVLMFSGESNSIDKLKKLIQEVLVYKTPAVTAVNGNVPTNEVIPIPDDNESCDEDFDHNSHGRGTCTQEKRSNLQRFRNGFNLDQI